MAIASPMLARAAAVALFVATFGGAYVLLSTGESRPSPGYVEEDRRSVGFTERGRLIDVLAVAGQQVRAGDVLAQLDPKQLDADIAALEAEAASLANRARTRALGVDRAERETASRATAAAEQARAARANATALRSAQGRVEEQIAAGLGGAEDLPGMRAEADSADALARSLEATASAIRGASVPDSSLSPDDAADAEREAIRQKVAALKVHREALVLKAPVDGRVAAVLHRVGDAVEPGFAVIEVVADRADRAVACVDAHTAPKLREGQPVRVFQPPDGAKVTGRVQAIGPAYAAADGRCRLGLYQPGYVLPVILTLDDGSRLVPGAPLQVFWLDPSTSGLVADARPERSTP